jgi:hypothetical protein
VQSHFALFLCHKECIGIILNGIAPDNGMGMDFTLMVLADTCSSS